jgi:hypothetical protein|tara:strand:+ start:1346 stop:1693 length:348 start_codon:yes stop_codon:yes gene_type:complete
MTTEMNTPQLNFDMISKILNMRMESKKEERIRLQAPFKKLYSEIMTDFIVRVRTVKDDILRDDMGSTALYGDNHDDLPIEEVNAVLDGYELMELPDYSILSPVEDDEPFNNLNFI